MVTANEIARCIKKWRKTLQLDPAWEIGFKLCSAEDIDREIEGALACIEVTDYLGARIQFCPDRIDKTNLDEVVLHELLHIILNPIALALQDTLGKDHDQLLTNMMESTIERLTPGYLARRRK